MKVGNLAMVVGANFLKQNIGKVVELSAFVSDGDLYAAPTGELFRHSDVPCWVVRGEGVVFRADNEVYEGFGLCEQHHLMLLPGQTEPTPVFAGAENL